MDLLDNCKFDCAEYEHLLGCGDYGSHFQQPKECRSQASVVVVYVLLFHLNLLTL